MADNPNPTPTLTLTPNPTPTPTPSDWTTGFNDDQKAYVQNKGFKNPGEILESYKNYEKLQGVPQDRLLRLPENMDSPEGRAVWERLGLPKEAKDYGLKAPEQGGDPKLAEWAQGIFHEIGIPRGMAEKLLGKWNERMTGESKTLEQNRTAFLTDAQNNLKTAWGNNFDQNKTIADQAAIRLGMGEKEVAALGQALGPDKAMQLLHKFGTATGEHTFVDGRPPGSGNMDPGQAKSAIDTMIGDATFRKRLSEGDADARRQWDNAHKMAFPGTIGL